MLEAGTLPGVKELYLDLSKGKRRYDWKSTGDANSVYEALLAT